MDETGDSTGSPKKSTGRLIVKIVLVVVIIAGAIWTWDEVIKYRVIAKRFGVVVPGSIYRSGQLSPTMLEKTLVNNEIDLVIALGDDRPDLKEHVAEKETVERLGIQRRIYPLRGDGTGDIASYANAIADIVETRDAGRRVLVHCWAGTYRTGGVVASYRMLIEGMSPADAWTEMEAYDWDSDIKILPEYLNSNMPELTRLLVERGVLDAVPDPLPVLEK